MTSMASPPKTMWLQPLWPERPISILTIGDPKDLGRTISAMVSSTSEDRVLVGPGVSGCTIFLRLTGVLPSPQPASGGRGSRRLPPEKLGGRALEDHVDVRFG